MSNQIQAIDKMFEYNLWANTQIMTLCAGLAADQLEVETEGVYGRIHPTLVHLVRAEGGYVNRLTGTRPWSDDLDWDNMPISELLEKVQLSGRQLADLASTVDAGQSHTVDAPWGKPFTFFNWTVLLQILYHGIEHRTQIKVLLTKLGVEHPELAAWDYTESLSPQG